MQFYIPTKGEKFKLTRDCTIHITHEPMNGDLLDSLGIGEKDWRKWITHYNLDNIKTVEVVLPKGAILSVQSIYMNRGSNSWFNTVSFLALKNENKSLGIRGRFHLPIDRLSELEFELLPTE